jgi:hypothetical protein
MRCARQPVATRGNGFRLFLRFLRPIQFATGCQPVATTGLHKGSILRCQTRRQRLRLSHIRNIFQKLHIDSGPDDHRRVLAVLTFFRSTDGT